ncbi:MAG: hypothetical protein WBI06_09565 [Paludibacter sp.]
MKRTFLFIPVLASLMLHILEKNGVKTWINPIQKKMIRGSKCSEIPNPTRQ